MLTYDSIKQIDFPGRLQLPDLPHPKKLRLPTFNNEYGKLARQCAAENREFAGKLRGLVLFVELAQNLRTMTASVI